MYSFSGNSAASIPIPIHSCICEGFIYSGSQFHIWFESKWDSKLDIYIGFSPHLPLQCKAWTNENTDDTCYFFLEGTVRTRAILCAFSSPFIIKDWNSNCIRKFRCFQMLNGTRSSLAYPYVFHHAIWWNIHLNSSFMYTVIYIPLYIRTCKENFHLLFKYVSDKLFLEQIAIEA